MRTWPLSLLALTLLTNPARAWDDFGHMEVAAVAYGKLTPLAKSRALQLLKLNPRYKNWTGGFAQRDSERMAFLQAATWADRIKSDPEYQDDKKPSEPTASQNIGYADKLRHGYWHYVDQPISADGTPTVPAPTPNAQTQIHAFRAVLADSSSSDDIKSYDLSWLLHLVGDVHQPLHCVTRFDQQLPNGDQGGNAIKIQGNQQPALCDDPRFCFGAPPTKLHIFWDDVIGDTCCSSEAWETAKTLPSADRQLATQLDESVWVSEGVELARLRVYVAPIQNGPGPFTITTSYAEQALEVSRQRIALAGVRLAKLLNAAFAAERAAKKAAPHPPG